MNYNNMQEDIYKEKKTAKKQPEDLTISIRSIEIFKVVFICTITFYVSFRMVKALIDWLVSYIG